jgi:protein-tyrosine phosphatase
MPKKVLVVCHGNVNRSPLCAAVLASRGVTVRSAGFVNPGKRASKKTRDWAAEQGYDLEGHRSQLLTPELMKWADIVIYMDNGNFRRLPKSNKAVCLGSFLGLTRIPDPAFMARGSKEFLDTMNLIRAASIELVGEL